MANQNNLLRPPVLNPTENNSNGSAATSSNTIRSISESDLVNLISRIALEVVNRQGPIILQSTLNPNSNINNVTDQTIDDSHLNNLADLDKIPDVVKCLREFSGKPGEYNSWKKSVNRILTIYEPSKGTPKYYGILNVIRNKIVGGADMALESYNTPLDWGAICKCLELHYADKRDISTLEYQMSSLIQGNNSIEEFYQAVYTNLSLILNKIGSMEVGNEVLTLLTQTYRNKALDTFVRGLNGDLPSLLGTKELVDLPQALNLYLKLENQKYRTSHAMNNSKNGSSSIGFNNNRRNSHQNSAPPLPSRNARRQQYGQQFHHEIAYLPRPQQVFARQYANNTTQNQEISDYRPPRPQAPKPLPPPEPMEVDSTIRSRRIDYMNRPQNPKYAGKRPPQPTSDQNVRPFKTQRNFHIDHTQSDSNNTVNGQLLSEYLEDVTDNYDEDATSSTNVNFLA